MPNLRNYHIMISHSWDYNEHYEKIKSCMEKNDKGKTLQYDIVEVRTSPEMIVQWAMQQGSKVEIMDKKIRAAIRKEIEKLKTLYNDD